MNRLLSVAAVVVAAALGCWGSVPAPASPPNEDRDDSSSSGTTGASEPSPLEAHAWEDRPLVVFAPDATNDEFRRQMEVFRTHRSGLAERKNVVYRVFADDSGQGPVGPLTAPEARALRDRFSPEEAFVVLLVGLDTTEKLRLDEPLEAERLFETIDAMPMREREMRREE